MWEAELIVGFGYDKMIERLKNFVLLVIGICIYSAAPNSNRLINKTKWEDLRIISIDKHLSSAHVERVHLLYQF